MECGDPGFRNPLFPAFRNRLSERSFEAHQFPPINPKVLGPNPFPFHSAGPIKSFRCADQNLFRVASPERARPPEWPRIDDCQVSGLSESATALNMRDLESDPTDYR